MKHQFNEATSSEAAADFYDAEIKGKTVLVTGVSPGGLGAMFAEAVSRHTPKLIILAGRDNAKGQATAESIEKISPGIATRLLQLDLGSQFQVRKAAAEVNGYEEPVDVLVNNAALMATEYSTTEDGLENQFGTNHIGHFLFTNLIMKKILASKAPRIVSVSSNGHRFSPVRFDDCGFQDGTAYQKFEAYGQAKTANILFAVSLAEKLGNTGLVANSLHPGVIITHLGRHMKDMAKEVEVIRELDRKLGNPQATRNLATTMKNISQGASTHIVAAFDPSLADHNGCYLSDCQVLRDLAYIKPYATDKEAAEKLWRLSESLVGETFSY